MTEDHIKEELFKTIFQPFRLHLVSGKTMDVLQPTAAMPVRDRLLVFRKMAKNGRSAEGYDVVAYDSIERIEQFDNGKRMTGKGR